MTDKFKIGLLLGITLIALLIISVIPPIPQDINYHSFADKRFVKSIPNFWNVISNLPFLFIGLTGMIWVGNSRPGCIVKELNVNCFVFFMGIFFTGIGSAYYHLHPNNNSLVWDRLPMTISFMAFFSIVIADHISLSSAKKTLLPLLLIGCISIQYWVMTENKGVGDLRMYALVQYLPVLLIPIILLLYKSTHAMKPYFWSIILVYALAKFFEASDEIVFSNLKILSGHSLKHAFAALAPALFLTGLMKRKTIKEFP